VRINPETLTVEALHHPPRLAVAPGGPVYVSWSSEKAKPEGTLFASDLQLSRSLDGGRRFEPPLRVNEDRPISHSFDGLAVAADGTVLLTWIDGHEGRKDPATWVARVTEQGTRVEGIRKVGDDTCVCCRVDAAAGAGNTVALTWRQVFPGDVRDMVLAVSRDGGRTFGDARLVSADHWKINACPHRGGAVGMAAIMAAHLAGAATVIAVDVHAERLAFAHELGATHRVAVGRDDNVATQIKKICSRGVDYVLDTSGHKDSLRAGLDVLAPGGRFGFVAFNQGSDASLQASSLFVGKALQGIIQGDAVPQRFIPELISFYRDGRFPFDRLVSFYDLQDIEQAFNDCAAGAVVKAVLRFPVAG